MKGIDITQIQGSFSLDVNYFTLCKLSGNKRVVLPGDCKWMGQRLYFHFVTKRIKIDSPHTFKVEDFVVLGTIKCHLITDRF